MNFQKTTLLILCIFSAFCHGTILENNFATFEHLLGQDRLEVDQIFIGNVINSIDYEKNFDMEQKTPITYKTNYSEDFESILNHNLYIQEDFSLPEISPFFVSEKEGVLGFLLQNRFPIKVSINDIFLSNHILQDRESSNKSLDEQLARSIMGKAMLKIGEDIMWSVLDTTFSNKPIITSIEQRPSKGLVILGILGGFGAYFGSQYYMSNSIEVPEISFKLSKNTSLGLEFWYVGENYNQEEVKNPLPFLVSLGFDV